MEQSPPPEATNRSCSQKIARLLWKVHYRVHKSQPLVPVLSHMNPVHNFPPYFPKILSTVILQVTAGFSKCSSHFKFSDQNSVFISHFPMRVTFPYHVSLLDLIILVIFGEEYRL